MTDHPMLFSPPMILALLREAKEPGTGKTQTRRILKPQPEFSRHHEPVRPEHRGGRRWVFMCRTDFPSYSWATADFTTGVAPGDRVWCRETFKVVPASAYRMSEGVQQTINPADRYDAAVYAAGWDRSVPRPWKPSIHMPRWASRLTLYVSEVRVQRLQEISEADARAEGVCFDPSLPADVHRCWLDLDPRTKGADWLTDWSAKDVYRQLWEHLNGPGSWRTNPFVAAYTFRPVLGNIDTLPANMMEDA